MIALTNINAYAFFGILTHDVSCCEHRKREFFGCIAPSDSKGDQHCKW